MNVDVPPELAPYMVVAIRMMARQAARDGYAVPPDLVTFADDLLRLTSVSEARRKALRAGRNARYRARVRERRAAAEQQLVA